MQHYHYDGNRQFTKKKNLSIKIVAKKNDDKILGFQFSNNNNYKWLSNHLICVYYIIYIFGRGKKTTFKKTAHKPRPHDHHHHQHQHCNHHLTIVESRWRSIMTLLFCCFFFFHSHINKTMNKCLFVCIWIKTNLKNLFFHENQREKKEIN